MNHAIQRLIQAVLTIFGALTVVFLILRLTPGDPVQIMLGDYATPELTATLRKEYGLDKPLPVQYVVFLKNSATGNFGMSLSQKTNVGIVIRGALPYTLTLAVAAMLVTCLIGVPLGVVAALKRNTFADFAAMVIALLGIATPGFLFALSADLCAQLQTRLVPRAGGGRGRGRRFARSIISFCPQSRSGFNLPHWSHGRRAPPCSRS